MSITTLGSTTAYNRRFNQLLHSYVQSADASIHETFQRHYFRRGLDAAELASSRDDWLRRDANVATMRDELYRIVRGQGITSFATLAIVPPDHFVAAVTRSPVDIAALANAREAAIAVAPCFYYNSAGHCLADCRIARGHAWTQDKRRFVVATQDGAFKQRPPGRENSRKKALATIQPKDAAPGRPAVLIVISRDDSDNTTELTVLMATRVHPGSHVWLYDTGDAAGHLATNTDGAVRVAPAPSSAPIAIDAGGRDHVAAAVFDYAGQFADDAMDTTPVTIKGALSVPVSHPTPPPLQQQATTGDGHHGPHRGRAIP